MPRRFTGIGPWPRYVGWLCLILFGLLVANIGSLRLRPTSLYDVDVGFWGDQNVLSEVFEQETDETGATYRWTTGRATFRVRGFASVSRPLFHFTLGGLPHNTPAGHPVRLDLDGTPLTLSAAPIPRTYHVMLPKGALQDGDLTVVFTTATSRVEPDPRSVGIRLDGLALGWSRGAWAMPDWRTLLIQGLLALVWLGISWRLAFSAPIRIAVVVGLALLLSWMTAYNLPTARAWETRLLVGSGLLLALLWAALPRLIHLQPALGPEDQLRWLLLIVVAAVSIRLFGVFYPPFDSHDLYLHRQRLQDVQTGSLQLFDTPTEFGGRRTIVPPAFYLLVSPITLLTPDPGVAIEGFFAVVDGIGILLIAMFVRLVGGAPRAAALAALVAASLPIQFTALWWGFGPQIVAHWLIFGAAVLAGRHAAGSRAALLGAGFILCVAFLMHPGVAVLGGSCLGFYVGLLWLLRRSDREQAYLWGVALAASALLAAILLYAEQVVPQIQGTDGGGATPEPTNELERIMLIGAGLQSSLRPIGVALALTSLMLLVLRARGTLRLVVLAWLGSVALFLVVDAALGLQVRYGYFAVPLVCAGLGLLLDRLIAQPRWGPLVAVCTLGLITWSGVSLWIAGVFLYIKPTLTALTH